METTVTTPDKTTKADTKSRKGIFPESLLKEYARFLVPIIE